MAAKPKLTPEQWADVRSHWELDPRDGYAWLVDELSLPVSAPAVRKAALRDGWTKVSGQNTDVTPKTQTKADKAPAQDNPARRTRKVSRRKVSKVFAATENHQNTVSETIGETMTTGKTIAETITPTPSADLVDDPDRFGTLTKLTDMQEAFVREYMVDWNGSKAAIRAGYSAKSADTLAYQLLQKPAVREAVETLASVRARRLGIDADELIRMWAAMVTFDANELSQLRRVCCPYCHGENHQRQYTPSGLEEAQKKHERERQRRLKADADDDIGEFPEYTDVWYDKRKPPNADCPECHGEGIAEVWYADTRTLSPAARLVYAGVRDGRDGIEILTVSKERAADNLARALGLFKEKETEVNINMVSGDALFQVYEEKMRLARERENKMMAERGMVIEAEDSTHGNP